MAYNLTLRDVIFEIDLEKLTSNATKRERPDSRLEIRKKGVNYVMVE
jgi:hypothetical protein